MIDRLSETQIDALRRRAYERGDLNRSEFVGIFAHIDSLAAELAALRADAGNAAYWRSAFERLQRDDASAQRDRLDRITSGATR
jgi:hypothetical protein